MLATIKALLFTTPTGATGKGAGVAPMPGTPDFAQLLDAATPQPSATASMPGAATVLPNTAPAPAALVAPTPVPLPAAGESGELVADPAPARPAPHVAQAAPDAPAMTQPTQVVPVKPIVLTQAAAPVVPLPIAPEAPTDAPQPVVMPAHAAHPIPTPLSHATLVPEAGESHPAIPQAADSPQMTTTPPSPLIQPVTPPDEAAIAAPVKAAVAAPSVARPELRTPIADNETDSETDIGSNESAGSEKAEPLSASLYADAQTEPSKGEELPLAMSVEPRLPPPSAPVASANPATETVDPTRAARIAMPSALPQPGSVAPLAPASLDRPPSEDADAAKSTDPLPLPDPQAAATSIVSPLASPVAVPDIAPAAQPARALAAASLAPSRITPAIAAPAKLAAATAQDVVADDALVAPLPVDTPIRAEAVSLLQLVRDHMTARAAPRQPTAAVQSTDTDTEGVAPLAATPRADGTVAPTPIPLPVQPAAIAPVLPTAPAADLSVSLGAQMVDIGVSGQWIDSLARDIAGLSANGAQGRFQINADTLGPIQIDIHQGEKGASVALTVATDLAEQALRQDGDRLRLDAGLAAVKISEVKIERAPAADTARSDQPGQNASGQPHQQGAGQPSFQGQGQGRWQARENIAQSHKASDDAAVLNHADAGDGSRNAVRARYA
jgi:flagellar hook-length control protein FliK